VAGCCECGDELSVSIKCGEVFGYLTTDKILKNDSAPWRYLPTVHASFLRPGTDSHDKLTSD
jgi:hypothetical protein